MRWSGTGIAVGLLASIVAVTLTYWFPEFRYPLSWHCAGWRIVVNLVVINVVSLFTRPSERMLEWQKRLDERTYDPDWYTPTARRWQKFLIFYIPFWWLMFVSPGIELGHYLDGVLFGAPGLWFRMIIGAPLGMFMLWAMCWGARWATPPKVTPEPLDEEGRRTITER
ncbi:hypothetical protein M1N05_01870 [Dehalococcoidales bacterium]|nr:hypothetical protein [Dehalococcoidales bacterium]